jgi:tetratricopeptide (TPR) repeat protein
MSSGRDELPAGASEPGSDGRLDSWKEIAAYLRRSVRSARRWEKEEGLPVRRHTHGKGDSVYAYKTELDRWWSDRSASLSDPNGAGKAALPSVEPAPDLEPGKETAEHGRDTTLPVPQRPRRVVWIGVGFAFAVLAVGAVAWLSRYGSGQSARSVKALPFKTRDWVLVAAFENRTGQALFDGTLEYSFARELSNSRYVNVVPRERVGDALRLMRKPLDTPVDAAIGREICLRDGDIRALITGRIERLGQKYLLTVDLVNPGQGASIASVAEEAVRDDELLPATRRISDRVRAMLGESSPLPAHREGILQKVTTPSLRVLQLYSQADTLIAAGNPEAAEELLRQAVAEDPSFASAWTLLAWTLENQGRPLAEFQQYLETALRLAETTTERERYFIRGSYYALSGQGEKAIAAYEALLSLYPDHFWATNNLAIIYRELGRDSEAVRFAVRRAELRPKDLDRRVGATRYLARLEPDRERVSVYARRTLERVSPEFLRDSPNAVTWLELFPANERWHDGDAAGALALATKFAEKLDSTPSLMRDAAFVQLGNLFLSLGRLKTAEGLFHRLSDPDYELAGLALLRGNRQELKRRSRAAVADSYDINLGAGILLARTGLIDQGEHVLKEWERDPREALPGMLEVARGELAMARGRSAEALGHLRRSQEETRDLGSFGFLLGSETLASALARQGDLDGAIRVLELGPKQKRQAAFHWVNTGAFWMRNQLLLARLYRRAGRDGDAQRVEGDLLKLLAVADADHPFVVELRWLQSS